MSVSDNFNYSFGYFQKSEQFYYILVNEQGFFAYANQLFQKIFTKHIEQFPGSHVNEIFSSNAIVKYNETVSFCLENPDELTTINLETKQENGFSKIIRWEFTIVTNESDKAKLVQGIGVGITESKNGNKVSEMPERYRAYEESEEGLWMFETEEPVSVNLSPDKIVSYWKQHAILAECNDNLARMYGFEKAEEMMGMRLEELIDFTSPVWWDYLKAFIKNDFTANKVETNEFDKDGNPLYFLNNMKGIVENGLLKRVWGTQHDITEQRTAEKQLKQSELFYRNLIAHSLDGVILTDDEGIITFASPSTKEILGYEQEEIVGKATFDFTHPDDQPIAIAAFNDELNRQPKTKFVWLRLQKKSGEWIWCIVRGHNLKHNPYIGQMMVYFFDDTLRKQAEDALLLSERRFYNQAIILNNVTDVIVTTDLNRNITSWNNVLEKLTGIAAEEAIGKPFRETMVSDYSPFTHDQVADIVFNEGIWRGEVSFEGRDGERKYLLHTVSMLKNEEGKNIGLLGVGKDITERRKVETMLQGSELFYRSLISHSLDGIVMTDANGQITYCAPSVTKLSGYEPQHLLGHSILDFVHPDDFDAAKLSIFVGVTKKSVLDDYVVVRLKHSNGNWVWCIVRGRNLLDNPAFNSIVIYFTDDSRRKKTEGRLKESEALFRHLLNNLSTGVILLDSTYKMVMCNKAGYTLLGLDENELLSREIFDPRLDLVHEDGSVFLGEHFPVVQSMKNGEAVSDIVMGVYNPKINGRVWLLVNAEPVFSSDKQILHVVCSFIDITEQKRLSQKLVEQEVQKQKQITQAAIDGQEKERQQIGKELHDNINQHLTTTRLYLEVAKEKASGEVREMIAHSHKNLVSIINEIRLLSQSLVPPTLGDLGLIESIQELCDSLRRVHTFKIDFYCRHFTEEYLPDNLKLMLFRITQEQINNIVRHAGSTLIQIRLQSDAEYIMLTIVDDGKGFNPANTKKGQGFNNITNRAALFNGKAEIEAMPGKGCTLTVVIPIAQN